jgi:Uncharacterized protein conserved in bacteria (DUF2332)
VRHTEPVRLPKQFSHYVSWFETCDAPRYAYLAKMAARELLEPGPFLAALEPFQDEPDHHYFPLRLFVLVHRWVLTGELPELAHHYPSVGSSLDD